MTKHIAEQFALLDGDQPEPPAIDGKAEIVTLSDLTPAEATIDLPPVGHPFWAALTEKYHDAVGAMPKVLAFGAWLLGLRDRVDSFDSTRGIKSEKNKGRYQKGTGLKAIIQERAPEIAISTAWRFMSVAESVREEFRLTPKIAKQIDFVGLATTPAENLPDPLRDKQIELFDFVSGTSQKSWLDKYKTKKPLGGKREKSDDETEELTEITPEQAARDLWIPILDGIKREGISERSWMHLSDEDRTALKGLLTDVLDCINGKFN